MPPTRFDHDTGDPLPARAYPNRWRDGITAIAVSLCLAVAFLLIAQAYLLPSPTSVARPDVIQAPIIPTLTPTPTPFGWQPTPVTVYFRELKDTPTPKPTANVNATATAQARAAATSAALICTGRETPGAICRKPLPTQAPPTPWPWCIVARPGELCVVFDITTATATRESIG